LIPLRIVSIHLILSSTILDRKSPRRVVQATSSSTPVQRRQSPESAALSFGLGGRFQTNGRLECERPGPGHSGPVVNDPQKVKTILLEPPQYLDAIVERIPNAMAASALPHVDGVHALTLPVSESLWLGWLTLAVAWLPAYLIKGAGYTTTQAGWVVVLSALTQIFPSPSIRFWSKRLLARGVTSRAARGLVALAGFPREATTTVAGALVRFLLNNAVTTA
jgi:hypothetical protein